MDNWMIAQTPRILATLLAIILGLSTGCGLLSDDAGDDDQANPRSLNNDANNAACTPTNQGVEVCDGIDNDCNGSVDDDAEDALTYYTDEDGDGFGADDSALVACEQPPGDVLTRGGDCDDANPDVHPDATEICDQIDNNCDGDTDLDGVQPQTCANQTGVCSGSQTTTCDAGAYAMCTASDFGALYTDRPDEAWRCDGLDNDCDGSTDPLCCADGLLPEATLLLTAKQPPAAFPFTLRERPAIVPAAPGAPDDAAFAAAWPSATEELSLQHFDRFGLPVGASQTVESPEPIVSVTLAPRSAGYELIWSSYAEDSTSFDSTLNAQSRKLDLSQESFPETLIAARGPASDARAFTLARAVALDDTVAVSWTDARQSNAGPTPTTLRSAAGALYDLADRETSLTELDLDGGQASDHTAVALHLHGDAFSFAWGEPARDRLSARLISPNRAQTARADVDLQGDLLDRGLDVVSSASDQVVFFYAESGVSGPELVASSLNLETSAVTRSPLSLGAQPSVRGIDADGDTFSESVAVLWQKSTPYDALFLRSIPLDNLGPDNSAELDLSLTFDPATPPALFDHPLGVGVTWRDTTDTGSELSYMPFSAEGIGVCPQQP